MKVMCLTAVTPKSTVRAESCSFQFICVTVSLQVSEKLHSVHFYTGLTIFFHYLKIKKINKGNKEQRPSSCFYYIHFADYLKLLSGFDGETQRTVC